eukprot:gene13794-44717_t
MRRDAGLVRVAEQVCAHVLPHNEVLRRETEKDAPVLRARVDPEWGRGWVEGEEQEKMGERAAEEEKERKELRA